MSKRTTDLDMSPLRLLFILGVFCAGQLFAANLNDEPADLPMPPTENGSPTAGKRVRATVRGWESSDVHHTLYLPEDWRPNAKWPVLVEFAGNGGYANKLGDASDGSVEGAILGYGLSAGRGCIWMVVPFVEIVKGEQRNAAKWWGDVVATKRYCAAAVREVCERYGGDPRRVVLMGFSRGAIACSYIGLHDEKIAKLWCGFLAHSHFEGEFKHPAGDEADWPERLRRLGNRPLFVSQELSTRKTAAAIAAAGVHGDITFADLPYPNHSQRWVVCDVALRRTARIWLARVIEQDPQANATDVKD